MVLPQVLVGLGLNGQHPLPRDVGIIVDDHLIRAHVEAHIVTVVGAAEHTGDDMLAGMLLHMVEAPRPVELAVDGIAHRQRLIAGVGDDAALFADILHRSTAQHAEVAGLTAALGIEGGGIQHHGEAALALLAGEDGGLKRTQKGVLII